MNIRGTHSLRHLSMLDWLDWLCGRNTIFGFYCLDSLHCVGVSRSVSRSLDCDKTLPRTATTSSRRDYRGLFHGVDQNSRALLCEVSSCCEYGFPFLLKGRTC
jgi:hypothetical protein